MKKIVVLIGSRRKNGNTSTFVRTILKGLSEKSFEIEYLFPQDFKIKPCVGCHKCFLKASCFQQDEIKLLHEKILEADVFFVASPVYLHYMTADLKLIMDRSVWWAHTLRLQGKPTVVLSTCGTNGYRSVVEPLSILINCMGGNVIATANAAQVPNQINNEVWLQSISTEVCKRVKYFSSIIPQSNIHLEKMFKNLKYLMLQQKNELSKLDIEGGELNYWKETGMINFDTFKDYLADKYGNQTKSCNSQLLSITSV